jgi:hypothetical protein
MSRLTLRPGTGSWSSGMSFRWIPTKLVFMSSNLSSVLDPRAYNRSTLTHPRCVCLTDGHDLRHLSKEYKWACSCEGTDHRNNNKSIIPSKLSSNCNTVSSKTNDNECQRGEEDHDEQAKLFAVDWSPFSPPTIRSKGTDQRSIVPGKITPSISILPENKHRRNQVSHSIANLQNENLKPYCNYRMKLGES